MNRWMCASVCVCVGAHVWVGVFEGGPGSISQQISRPENPICLERQQAVHHLSWTDTISALSVTTPSKHTHAQHIFQWPHAWTNVHSPQWQRLIGIINCGGCVEESSGEGRSSQWNSGFSLSWTLRCFAPIQILTAVTGLLCRQCLPIPGKSAMLATNDSVSPASLQMVSSLNNST